MNYSFNLFNFKKTHYLYSGGNEERMKWFSIRYGKYLTGNILDIGADELYLKKYLDKDVEYIGIGLGNHPDLIKIDLEKQEIPYPSNSFDCVLCLDVLEHIENIYNVFDRICDLAKKWIIISLPNPYSDLLQYFNDKKNNRYYYKGKNLKYYGLDLEKPVDRHKWFFSVYEARDFIENRILKNGGTVHEIFIEHEEDYNEIKNVINKENPIFSDFDFSEIYLGTSWYVLVPPV